MLGFPLRSTYGISKAAVMHMTRMLAIEWAEHQIRVNSIAPGTVLTATRKEYADSHPGYLDKMVDRSPLKRTCAPEDIAAAAGATSVAVIAGIGARNYYRKLGYVLLPEEQGGFMVKRLPLAFRAAQRARARAPKLAALLLPLFPVIAALLLLLLNALVPQ